MKKFKKRIRNGVFETNSSSCHSLTIPKQPCFSKTDGQASKKINKTKQVCKSMPVTIENGMLKVELKNFNESLTYFSSLEDKIAFVVQLLFKDPYDFFCTDNKPAFFKTIPFKEDELSDLDNVFYTHYKYDLANSINHTFQKLVLNDKGKEVIEFVKSILKKHYNIEDLLVTCPFFSDVLEYELLENGESKDILYFYKKSEEVLAKNTGNPYELVNVEDFFIYGLGIVFENRKDNLTFTGSYSIQGDFSPFLQKENEWQLNKDLLESFLIDNRSFIRIGDTQGEYIPFNDEDKRTKIFNLKRKNENSLEWQDVVETIEDKGFHHIVYSFN